MEELLREIRQSCSAPTWSRGVELARSGAVVGVADRGDEVELRVTMKGGVISPLVSLFPDELEWEGIEQEKAAFAEPATRIIDRAVESGAVRSDFSFADFPMLMCGITSTMYFAPAGSDWQRHLDLILAGLRPG